VDISVRNYGNHVEVDIKDDGKGFNVAEIHPSTHGLAGMRHRVEAAGGRLTVISAPGNGTRISAVLPKGTVGA
jgi:signal transduction histidine kinase